jgi:hypothetical protein
VLLLTLRGTPRVVAGELRLTGDDAAIVALDGGAS